MSNADEQNRAPNSPGSPMVLRFYTNNQGWVDVDPNIPLAQQPISQSWYAGQPSDTPVAPRTFMETTSLPAPGQPYQFAYLVSSPQFDSTRDLNLPSCIEVPSRSGSPSPIRLIPLPPTMFLTTQRFGIPTSTPNNSPPAPAGPTEAPATEENRTNPPPVMSLINGSFSYQPSTGAQGQESDSHTTPLATSTPPPSPNNRLVRHNDMLDSAGATMLQTPPTMYAPTPHPFANTTTSFTFSSYFGTSSGNTTINSPSPVRDPRNPYGRFNQNNSASGMSSPTVCSSLAFEEYLNNKPFNETNFQNAVSFHDGRCERRFSTDSFVHPNCACFTVDNDRLSDLTSPPNVCLAQAEPYRISPINTSSTKNCNSTRGYSVLRSNEALDLDSTDQFFIISLNRGRLKSPIPKHLVERNLGDSVIYFASTDLNATHSIEAVEFVPDLRTVQPEHSSYQNSYMFGGLPVECVC